MIEPAHPSVDARKARGKAARERTSLSAHRGWVPAAAGRDPVALLEEQNLTREPDLVPVRHGRMMASPFTFYRGAAKIMAADLEDTPTAGLNVQLCGDAHLSNFGVFASPERQLLFDLNDFDETLPGPFEIAAPAVKHALERHAKIRLIHVLDDRFVGYTAGGAWQDAMLGLAHPRSFDRIAVITDSDSIRRLVKVAGWSI